MPTPAPPARSPSARPRVLSGTGAPTLCSPVVWKHPSRPSPLAPSTSSGCSPAATTIPPLRPAHSTATATGSSWPKVEPRSYWKSGIEPNGAAHASSTVLNDPVECLAIRLALGPHADQVAVSGTKGLHGHALGATGAMETAICAIALERSHLPGTANLIHRDSACDLDIIPPGGRDAPARYLLKNSFGFGGINACLVLGAAT